MTPWPAVALQEKCVSETNLATGAALVVSRILDAATAGLAGSQASRANKHHDINYPEPVARVYEEKLKSRSLTVFQADCTPLH